jgi:hypothetical protein
MTTPNHTSDLDWLAFCYAAGELDAPAAEQFEAHLATDQLAREALARAVELTQTVTAAEHQLQDLVTPVTRAGANWNSRLSWMAIGGLASVLVALLWTGFVGPTWQTALRSFNTGGLNASAQQHLALAWHETGVEIANVKEAGLWPYSRAIGQDDDDVVGFAESGPDSDLVEAPSWMMAAVFGSTDSNEAEPTSGQFE